jgi:hypothetical protein
MPIRQCFLWVWALSLMLLHSPTRAADQLELLSRSVYKGTISGWKVEMVRTLTHTDKGHYQLRSEAKNMFATVVENSDFTVKNQRLLPLDYIYDRRVFSRQATEKIRFDWNSRNAFYTRSDRTQNNTQHPLHGELLDPALYQLALQADLANGVTDLNYTFIKRKRLETYNFQLLPGEKFPLQKKTYDALVLIREDKEKNKATKVWILPELNYQVGKIQHTDDGDTFQVTLSAHEGDSTKLKAFYGNLLRNPSQ